MGCKHNEFFNYQCICTINSQISLGCAILNLLLVQVVGIEKSSQNDKLLSLTKEVGRTIFANINYILSKFHEIAQEFGEIVTAGTNIKKMCNHQEIQQQSLLHLRILCPNIQKGILDTIALSEDTVSWNLQFCSNIANSHTYTHYTHELGWLYTL